MESTLKGIGLVRAPTFAVNEHLKEGRLIHLLPKYQSIPERGVYAMYPDKRFLPVKVGNLLIFLRITWAMLIRDFKLNCRHHVVILGPNAQIVFWCL